MPSHVARAPRRVFGSPSVIGENVMLTVATSDVVVGPTRLLFPKLPGGSGEAAGFPFSLLGLGDVAVPGEAQAGPRAAQVAADCVNYMLAALAEPGSIEPSVCPSDGVSTSHMHATMACTVQ